MKTKEIYKIRNGNWGIIVSDNDGNYITTICVKTQKYAVEVSNNPETLEWLVNRTIKHLEKN
jgi:ribosomal protein L24E